MSDIFRKFAQKTSAIVGTPWAFIIAVLLIVLWGTSGGLFHYSDTWQLVINTSTTIITFLIVFLIQNSQNRDTRSINLKLDELIHATKGARNKMMGLENVSDEELESIYQELKAVYNKRRERKEEQNDE